MSVRQHVRLTQAFYGVRLAILLLRSGLGCDWFRGSCGGPCTKHERILIGSVVVYMGPAAGKFAELVSAVGSVPGCNAWALMTKKANGTKSIEVYIHTRRVHFLASWQCGPEVLAHAVFTLWPIGLLTLCSRETRGCITKTCLGDGLQWEGVGRVCQRACA